MGLHERSQPLYDISDRSWYELPVKDLLFTIDSFYFYSLFFSTSHPTIETIYLGLH